MSTAVDSQVTEPKQVNDVTTRLARFHETRIDCTDVTERKQQFLTALTATGIVLRAARAAGVSRRTVYFWRQVDAEFREAWEQAQESAVDMAEDSLYQQAISQRNVVATIFYLKGNRSKYKDRVQVDVNAIQREIEERVEKLAGGQITTAGSFDSHAAKDILADVLSQQRLLSSSPTTDTD
jgi:hypothetical protein